MNVKYIIFKKDYAENNCSTSNFVGIMFKNMPEPASVPLYFAELSQQEIKLIFLIPPPFSC